MNEIHGVTGKPYDTPGVRRKLPDPHQRPRIDLDGGRRVKRSWKDTSVLDVQAFDTVAGFGIVAEIDVKFRALVDDPEQESLWLARLTNVLGEIRDYGGEQRVYAFSKDADG